MNKIAYEIKQDHNKLTLFKADKKEKLLTSFWFMEFGKTAAEINDEKGNLKFEITKKFEFWKWRMAYYIKENSVETSVSLLSQNSRNTIFKVEFKDAYEIKIHYQKKKSVYKNGFKIAEFDETLNENEVVKLLISDEKELEIAFLLYTCLFVGETNLNLKSSFKSQKELEKNEENWF